MAFPIPQVNVTHQGYAAPGFVQCQCNMRGPLSKLKRMSPLRKIIVTSKSPVGDISVVTLIRTDTTLDHSQKAEKVCSARVCVRAAIATLFVDEAVASIQQPASAGRSEGRAMLWRTRDTMHNVFASARCWQLLGSKLPHEKFCYG